MKFFVEFVTADGKSDVIDNISKEIDDRGDAYEFLDNLVTNLKPGLRVTFKKITPVVMCSCGENVLCPSFTNTCDKCGTDYNFNGNMLTPREQWGEETGESWFDCY